jgi:TIR domain
MPMQRSVVLQPQVSKRTVDILRPVAGQGDAHIPPYWSTRRRAPVLRSWSRARSALPLPIHHRFLCGHGTQQSSREHFDTAALCATTSAVSSTGGRHGVHGVLPALRGPLMAHAARIFVSHAPADTAWCRAFVQALREAGADVWYDEHHLGDGVSGQESERELQARPIFIAILSPAALASPRVQREIRAATGVREKDRTRSLLLVLAEPADVPRLWAAYPRVSGPGDRGLSPPEAARQAMSTLASAPAHTPGAAPVSASSEPARSHSLPPRSRRAAARHLVATRQCGAHRGACEHPRPPVPIDSWASSDLQG